MAAQLLAEAEGALAVISSALPEQVVKDILVSAFDSAGQRCSALRVLYESPELWLKSPPIRPMVLN